MASGNLNRIIIIGGGYAGLAAASRLSQSSRFKVTLIDAKDHFYERIRLHEVAADRDFKTWAYTDELAKWGVEFVQARVVALDPKGLSVDIDDAEGRRLNLKGSQLVYALGSVADDAALPGLADHGFALSSLERAIALRERLRASQAPKVVIGGGGLTAVELAAELAEARPNAEITLVSGGGLIPHREPGGFQSKALAHIRSFFEAHRVTVLDGQRVSEVEVGHVILQDGKRLPADVYVHASGFRISNLAAKSGLKTDASGRILVDGVLRSLSHPGVIAIGDAASARTNDGHPARLSCATALPMGVSAARIIGELADGNVPKNHVPGYAVRNVSLGRTDGVVQFLDDEDRPLSFVWTGKKAARWKEYICRTTLHTIRFQDEPKIPHLPPLWRVPHMIAHARKVA